MADGVSPTAAIAVGAMSRLRVTDGTTLPGCGFVRPLDDERHVHRLLVERRPVPPPAVLLELLAVVGGDDDLRVVVQPQLLQVLEQVAELLVEVVHVLPVELVQLGGAGGGRVGIRDPGDAAPVVRNLEVRVVRVHVVHPEEERIRRALIEPVEHRAVHHGGVLGIVVEVDAAAEEALAQHAQALVDRQPRRRVGRPEIEAGAT